MLFLPSSILLLTSILFTFIIKTQSLKCSTNSSGPIQCNHFYNTTLNESTCAIWWTADEISHEIKHFQLPPAEYSCFSDYALSKSSPVFSNNDYQFDEKCIYQTYLTLAGLCFCKTGDFCNEKLLNNETKLNDLIAKMSPPTII